MWKSLVAGAAACVTSISLFCAGAVGVGAAPSSSSQRASLAAEPLTNSGGARTTPRTPLTPCGAFGYVVWMIYVNPGASPVGNTCWTIIKPIQSTTSSLRMTRSAIWPLS